MRLLTESWRRHVPLIYSNLELLLPVGVTGTSAHYLDTVSLSGLQGEPAPFHPNLRVRQLNENASQKASATNSKCVSKVSRLSRKRNTTVCNATSSPSLKQNCDQRTLKKAEQKAASVETGCLEALADFFDLMSYLDAMVSAPAPLVSGSCRPEAFIWTGAEIKDGLLDEMRQEESRSQDVLLDIQAAAEGLGFWQVAKAWTEGQNYRQEMGDKTRERLLERVIIPEVSQKQSLSFIVQPLCEAR